MKVTKTILNYDNTIPESRRVVSRSEEVIYQGGNDEFAHELMAAFEKHAKSEGLNTSVDIGDDLLLSAVFVFGGLTNTVYKKCLK